MLWLCMVVAYRFKELLLDVDDLIVKERFFIYQTIDEGQWELTHVNRTC